MRKCSKCNRILTRDYRKCPYCGTYDKNHNESFALEAHTVLAERYEIISWEYIDENEILYLAADTINGTEVTVKELFIDGFSLRTPGENGIGLYHPEQYDQYMSIFQDVFSQMGNRAKISSDSITDIIDLFSENNTVYLVEEFPQGTTLAKELAKNRRIKETDIQRIIKDITGGLSALHKYGIFHLNISPDDIIIQPNGQTILRNIGMRISPVKEAHMVDDSNIYTPRELTSSGESIGSWTDVYEIGQVIYEAVTGVQPKGVLEREKAGEEIQLPHKISANLKTAVRNATRIRAAARTKTAEEFSRQASSAKEEKVLLPYQKKRKCKLLWAILLFLLLTAGAVFGYYGFQWYKKNRDTKENPIQVVLPSLIGMNKDDAEQRLKELGLYGNGKPNYNRDRKYHEVFSQVIAAGELVDEGSTIEYQYSAGSMQCKAEDFKGKTLEEVEEMLLTYKIAYTIGEAVESLYEEGKVDSVEPETFETGDWVKLFCSKEKEKNEDKAVVPDLLGCTKEEAIERIKELGFTLCKVSSKYINPSDMSFEDRRIGEQLPAAGEIIAKSETIELTVFYKTVSWDLSDSHRTPEEAKAYLEQCGITVKILNKNTNVKEQDGVILALQTESGKVLNEGKDYIAVGSSIVIVKGKYVAPAKGKAKNTPTPKPKPTPVPTNTPTPTKSAEPEPTISEAPTISVDPSPELTPEVSEEATPKVTTEISPKLTAIITVVPPGEKNPSGEPGESKEE